MGYASDLVNQGFYGYAGWGDAEARADFQATGGAGKGGQSNASSSSGGGSSFKPPSAAELSDIQNKVYNQLKPYYLQLITESNGDFDMAVRKLNEDYTRGTRIAGENYNRERGNTLGELKGSLDALGINFNQEQDKGIDTLNNRGMAVYQNGPNGEYNVVQKQLPTAGAYNPASANLSNLNPNAPDNSGITPTQQYGNQANLGRGGYELNQLLQDQQLRQEAIQRSANQKIQGLGIDYKNYTNPTATNPSEMGTAELTKQRGVEAETRQKQQRGEDIYGQLEGNVANLSSGFANNQIKASDVNLQNMYNKQEAQNFINTGK